MFAHGMIIILLVLASLYYSITTQLIERITLCSSPPHALEPQAYNLYG